ncbi:MAG TPA: hypothetical protein VM597_16550 [Gemmataceae bacterium]|jgi:Flp pilus assembly pilin Flp|nr:hypothetical protein [Gemmataceae bacterium]
MNVIRKFNDDEAGLETLQVVMIVAVAAVILALVKNQWDPIKQFFTDKVKDITGFNT